MVSGGYDMASYVPLATVQVYDNEGAKEQLPDLLTRRSYHACAHYVDSENRVVSNCYLSLCPGPDPQFEGFYLLIPSYIVYHVAFSIP